MSLRVVALCIDAHDPPALARFWSGMLGWEITGGSRRPNWTGKAYEAYGVTCTRQIDPRRSNGKGRGR